jgi:alpha-galactosidase
MALPLLLASALPMLRRAAAITTVQLPVMGYSNWYDTKCDVHAARFLEAASALERTGLLALGYSQINVDAGWALPARHATTRELVPDPRFFPRGMAALAADLAGRGFKLGGYTDRGTQQCGPSPGSKGYEDIDAEQFARWNLSYVKSDDCSANLTFAQGMADYEKFGAALRTAGNGSIYYLICGCKLGVGSPDPRTGWEQCPAVASRAGSTINAWRIASDDYTWPNVLTNANINAGLTQFSRAGKFNDPDMLINQPLIPAGWPSVQSCPNLEQWKTVRKRGFPPYAISSLQARLQMSLWCVMGAPLILSLNVRNLSAFDLATYGNAEAVAINQDTLVLGGTRLRGGNLTTSAIVPPSPPLPPAPAGTRVFPNLNVVDGQCAACRSSASGCCVDGKPNPSVQYLSHHQTRSFAACETLCRTFRGRGGLPSDTKCHSWVWNSINHDCFGRLDEIFDTNQSSYRQTGIDSGTFLNVSIDEEAKVTERHPPPPPFGNFSTTNVWGKRLNDSGFCLLFLNVGPTTSPPITCDDECIAELLGADVPTRGQRFRVRDVWAHKDLGVVVAPLRFTAPRLEADTVHMIRVSRALPPKIGSEVVLYDNVARMIDTHNDNNLMK